MTEHKDIDQILDQIFHEENLISATLSAPRIVGELCKVVIRSVRMKGKLLYQITKNSQQKAVHENFSREDCLRWLSKHCQDFKQSVFYTSVANYHLLIGKKGNHTLLKKKATKIQNQSTHNRQKGYLWKEGEPIPFLIHLGIMNQEGKIYPGKYDKFRQINRFLEMIDDVLSNFDSTQPLRVVDFGCGKAYLTFALYHYLKITKGFQIHLIGLDVKKDVIAFCQELAQNLGYQRDLEFIHQDINEFEIHEKIDIMVSLHACDTATDAALEKAIRWKTKVILCVPCCQHEVLQQIQQEALHPLLKHGILKERFAALATDAARVQLLEVLGYQTQIMEFIDIENTPKNLLIRAVRHSSSDAHKKTAWQAYDAFKKLLSIFPSLERRFVKDLGHDF